jgi:hypothetical protein
MRPPRPTTIFILGGLAVVAAYDLGALWLQRHLPGLEVVTISATFLDWSRTWPGFTLLLATSLGLILGHSVHTRDMPFRWAMASFARTTAAFSLGQILGRLFFPQ